ncbi:acyltransferase [Terrimonas sp. NA20]|uniref:Acyltransferase n=1 Tax=Terrimonas ginsenosidimutans TaxID=2908004 RepID=A0ABS9L0C6_9BACT|nr:acyltransferase [Terrimonas ginsenosidimutans]MCG2618074.1 acyltransferase [Terrimonas ginsenosidimutans]
MKRMLKKVLGKNAADAVRPYFPMTRSKWKLILIKRRFKEFGERSTITSPSIFQGMENISIGKDSDIGAFVHIWGNGGVTIGDGVLIASHVVITSLTHSYSGKQIKNAPTVAAPIHIDNGVWIGAHAVIMPGVTIGEGAVIGAGAIVTSNVPAMAIAVGVPARIIKYRE